MSIKNINLLGKVEVKDDSSQYTIQALANLGQRTGTKGDSISLNSISFNDLLDTEEDSSSYVGVIKYMLDDNNLPICKYGLISKENLMAGDEDFINYNTMTHNIFSIKMLDTKLSTDIIVNNCELLTENSCLQLDNDHFATILFLKVINSNAEDPYDIELQYNVFDIKKNVIDFGIRVWQQSNDTNNQVYLMMTVERNTDTTYELNIYRININNYTDADSLVKIAFDEYFCSQNQTGSANINEDIFTLLENIDITDYKHILDSSKSNNIFSYIKDNCDASYTNFTAQFNKDIQNGFTIDDETIFSQYNNFVDKYGIEIGDRIKYLSNDINILYPRLLEYYCDNEFFKDKKTLAFQIFSKIYENILIDEYKTDDLTLIDILNNSSIPLALYIPLSYKLKYYSSSSSSLNIYSSKEIYVSFINSFSSTVIANLFSDDSSEIVAKYDNTDKVAAYNVEVEYSDIYSDIYNNLITEFDVIKSFTLPYIDKATGNWKINDNLTTFKSYMFTNIAQQILIVYFYKDENGDLKYTILNTISDDISDILNESSVIWHETTCTFSSATINTNSENSNNISTIVFDCLIPTVTDIYKSYFDNCLLFTIFDQSCLSNSNALSSSIQSIIDRFNNFRMATIWTFDDSSGTFKYVKESDLDTDGSDCAFDLSEIFNMRSSLIRSMDETNNVFKNIVIYNKNTQAGNKQYVQSTPSHIVIYDANNESSGVSNNLALKIKASSMLEMENNSWASLSYISSPNAVMFLPLSNSIEDTNIVTNSEYSLQYTVNDSNNLATSYNYILNKATVENMTQMGALSYFITNRKSLSSLLSTSDTTTTSYTTTIDFDEYTFNTDIPILDLKEFIISNSNTLNRINLLSLASNRDIYHSFIGSPVYSTNSQLLNQTTADNSFIYAMYRGGFGNSDNGLPTQSVLQLTSSTTDINLGHDTMISKDDIDKFKKQSLYNIKFDNILIETNNLTTRVKEFTNSQFIGALNTASVFVDNKIENSNNFKISYNDPTNSLLGNSDITVLLKDFEPVGIVRQPSETKNIDQAFSYIFSNYGVGDMTFDIFEDTENQINQITIENIIRELYLYNDIISDDDTFNIDSFDIYNNGNININSFFIKISNPNTTDKPESLIYTDDVASIKDQIAGDIYLFRLSDYLYRIYGLNISNANDWVFDDDYSLDSRLFRIKISNTEYSYFLIFFNNEIESKIVSSNQSSNSPKYEIAKLKHHIQLMKRQLSNNIFRISIFLNNDNMYPIYYNKK